MRQLLLPAIVGCALALPAWAGCLISGAKCVEVPESTYTGPYQIGDEVPPGKFNILLNTTYHGLEPSDGTFWYARVGRHVYKIDPATLTVLEDVTWDARRLSR